MSTIKFKNGTKWEELSLGGGDLLDQYPVGSVYVSPKITDIDSTLKEAYIASNATSLTSTVINVLNSIKSPAELFGGNWQKVYLTSTYGQSYYAVGLFTENCTGISYGSGVRTVWQNSSGGYNSTSASLGYYSSTNLSAGAATGGAQYIVAMTWIRIS